MIKKPSIKSQDKEINRSILKSNSPRQGCSSSSQTKVGNGPGNGIFRRTSLLDKKNGIEESHDYVRETRSESITQNKDQNIVSVGGTVRKTSPDKLPKKVHFVDAIINEDGKVQQNPFRRLLECDKSANIRNLLTPVDDLDLARIIDDKTDNLLTLLSAMPTESEHGAHDNIFGSNINLLSKMTLIDRASVTILLLLFVIMILKNVPYGWQSASTSLPQLTGPDILVLVRKNIKRMWSNLVTMDRYF